MTIDKYYNEQHEMFQLRKFRNLRNELRKLQKDIRQNTLPSEAYLEVRNKRIKEIKWEMMELVKDM